MSVFVQAQGIKSVHAGGGGDKKKQIFVHVVVECPLTEQTPNAIDLLRGQEKGASRKSTNGQVTKRGGKGSKFGPRSCKISILLQYYIYYF